MKRYPGKPIIFSASMILAILEGRKVQTRRVVKPQPVIENGVWRWKPREGWDVNVEHINKFMCPYWNDEYLLWVKENFRLGDFWDNDATTLTREGEACIPKGAFVEGQKALGKSVPTVRYEADGTFNYPLIVAHWKPGKLHPSIFMPHWAHRIDLELLDARVEQVQDINREDCLAEGITYEEADMCDALLEDVFADLWDHINLKRGFGWNVNPWVWILTFDPIPRGA